MPLRRQIRGARRVGAGRSDDHRRRPGVSAVTFRDELKHFVTKGGPDGNQPVTCRVLICLSIDCAFPPIAIGRAVTPEK